MYLNSQGISRRGARTSSAWWWARAETPSAWTSGRPTTHRFPSWPSRARRKRTSPTSTWVTSSTPNCSSPAGTWSQSSCASTRTARRGGILLSLYLLLSQSNVNVMLAPFALCIRCHNSWLVYISTTMRKVIRIRVAAIAQKSETRCTVLYYFGKSGGWQLARFCHTNVNVCLQNFQKCLSISLGGTT